MNYTIQPFSDSRHEKIVDVLKRRIGPQNLVSVCRGVLNPSYRFVLDLRSIYASRISIQDMDLNLDLNLGLEFRSEFYVSKDGI